MTSFVGALAEGLSQAGVRARVVGLARTTSDWVPQALGPCESSAPWLAPAQPRFRDRVEAERSGILDDVRCGPEAPPSACLDWHLEQLLQREISSFMQGEDDGVLLVYPRSFFMLCTSVRIAARLGLRVLAFSTEALSDAQIDPTTREDYIRCVVRCCDGVWAISNHLAEFWRTQGVPAPRLFVSVPPVRDSFFPQLPKAADATPVVFIGNLAHREIDHLIEISESVAAEVSGYKLDIFGDAPESRRRELQSAIDGRGLAGIVTVRAAVSPLEVPTVLRGARALLLPRASGEFSAAGFPNKLGEYLASGRPVIVTAVGDIPRYLVDGVSALLVPPDDNAAFARAVVRVLEDGELAERLGAGGRAVAERLFRAERVARAGAAFVHQLPWTVRTVQDVGTAKRLVRLCAAARDEYLPAFKRGVVAVLRFLHLKAPAPASERR